MSYYGRVTCPSRIGYRRRDPDEGPDTSRYEVVCLDCGCRTRVEFGGYDGDLTLCCGGERFLSLSEATCYGCGAVHDEAELERRAASEDGEGWALCETCAAQQTAEATAKEVTDD